MEEFDVFEDFKDYLYIFITSNCVKTALKKEGNHENIINLINSGIHKKIINSKLIRFVPVYLDIFYGYTNKDILISLIISLISNYPYLLPKGLHIKNKEEYSNFSNVLLLFSINVAFIDCLHEVLIHLSFGYLSQITDGKISPISTKESKKNVPTNKKKTKIILSLHMMGEYILSI